MPAIVRSEREIGPRQRAGIARHAGRKPGLTAGSYVHDLAALGKAITLCPGCAGKFPAERLDYVVAPHTPFVRGYCDGCRDFFARMRMFLKRGHIPR